MTVIKGKVYPDHEFPRETFGYAADRDSAHNFSTPLCGRDEAMKQVAQLQSDPQTYRLRLARYELVEVVEFECAGRRPEVHE